MKFTNKTAELQQLTSPLETS